MHPQVPSSARRLGKFMARSTLLAVLATLTVAVVLLSAGAVQATGHEDPSPPQLTDPEGDAMEGHSDATVNQASGACTVSWETSAACQQAVSEAEPHAPNAGGEPAHPALDILSVTLQEDATTLNVTLEVAELDGNWAGIHREGEFGPEPAGVFVEWFNDEQGGCFESVGLFFDDFEMAPTPGIYFNAEDHCGQDPVPEEPWEQACNYYWLCMTGTEVHTELGSPGFITWSVPRDTLVAGEAGSTLHDLEANARRYPSDDVHGYVGWSAGSQDVHTGGWVATSGYTVDDTDPGSAFTFQTAQEPWPDAEPDEPHTTGSPYDDPRGQLLTFDVEETPEELSFVATLAQVEDTLPERAAHFVWLGLPTGHVIEVSVYGDQDDGGTYETYGLYWEPGPDEPFYRQGQFIVFPVELEVSPGEPGSIAVTIERSQLPAIESGSLSNLLGWTVVHDYPWNDGARVDEAESSARLYSPYVRGGNYSGTGTAPLYRFLHDTPSQVMDTFARIPDGTGDTEAPDPAFDQQLQNRFDITYIEARALDETETHLTIGISDLSRATVPRGYEGMFYGLAVQSGERTTMVGYHKAADAPAGDFLCAPDITVLTETQRDPTEAVWTLIEGVVSAPPGASGGTGGPGAITFHVPNACFSDEVVDEENADLTFDRFAAGTYVVRSGSAGLTQGTVYEVDTAEADGPLSLEIPEDTGSGANANTQAASWYAAPFGVESFWDIMGLGFALAIATGGATVKLRRRKLDKAALADAKAREDRDVYREALERAVVAGVDPADDTVLRALRNRLGISEREHALLELEACAAAGRGVTGLTEGVLFLGKYRIERQLGEGGFARTYLARDEKLARDVVLKVARWDTPKEMQRALREARILARAEHANIVRVIDVEEVADLGVIVLEHVPGGSLAEHLQDLKASGDGHAQQPGSIPLAQALKIIDDVLAGLEAAHEEGIVHRDVKPANILLTRDGRAKLADFGIARAQDGAAGGGGGTGTVTGATLSGSGSGEASGTGASAGAGTLQYMAPEQARGERADERSDIYAAGAVLYEMITGSPCIPLDGLPEFEARNAVAEIAPRLPIEGVPAHVNELLAAALAKDADARPQSAGEMRGMVG